MLIIKNLLFLLSGFTSWAANSGCRDINECCVGSYAECSHTCTRTSATSGLCLNNAGSYSCGTCSTGGTVLTQPGRKFQKDQLKVFTPSCGLGLFYSHNGWDGDTKKYSQTDRQWTLVAPPGKRVLLRIKDFYVKLLTFLSSTGAQGVTLSVADKVFSLHLSGSNLQAISQQSVKSQSSTQRALRKHSESTQ